MIKPVFISEFENSDSIRDNLKIENFEWSDEKFRLYCFMWNIFAVDYFWVKKSEKKNGIVRYCNKHQCRICQNKCFDENGKIPYKEVDFSKRVRYKIKK